MDSFRIQWIPFRIWEFDDFYRLIVNNIVYIVLYSERNAHFVYIMNRMISQNMRDNLWQLNFYQYAEQIMQKNVSEFSCFLCPYA